MTEQHLFAESQAERLQAIERTASEEINEFRGNAEKAKLEFQTIRDQLEKVQAAEILVRQIACDAAAEAETAKQQNKELWSEINELQRTIRAPCHCH